MPPGRCSDWRSVLWYRKEKRTLFSWEETLYIAYKDSVGLSLCKAYISDNGWPIHCCPSEKEGHSSGPWSVALKMSAFGIHFWPSMTLVTRALRDWILKVGRDQDRFFAQKLVFGRDRVRFWDWKKSSGFFRSFGLFIKTFFCCFDGHVTVLSLVTLAWLSRISILISFW
jgi:hypothetical protein